LPEELIVGGEILEFRLPGDPPGDGANLGEYLHIDPRFRLDVRRNFSRKGHRIRETPRAQWLLCARTTFTSPSTDCNAAGS
jgi:hypothetical protein